MTDCLRIDCNKRYHELLKSLKDDNENISYIKKENKLVDYSIDEDENENDSLSLNILNIGHCSECHFIYYKNINHTQCDNCQGDICDNCKINNIKYGVYINHLYFCNLCITEGLKQKMIIVCARSNCRKYTFYDLSHKCIKCNHITICNICYKDSGSFKKKKKKKKIDKYRYCCYKCK
jgi:hypothetical protein